MPALTCPATATGVRSEFTSGSAIASGGRFLGEPEEPLGPVVVGVLGPEGVVPDTSGLPQAVEQLRRMGHGLGGHANGPRRAFEW